MSFFEERTNRSKPRQELISNSYVRNAWYVAAWSEGVSKGQLVGLTIMGEPIAFYRKADGLVAAIEDRCPHRFAPLHMGKILDGNRIQCVSCQSVNCFGWQRDYLSLAQESDGPRVL